VAERGGRGLAADVVVRCVSAPRPETILDDVDLVGSDSVTTNWARSAKYVCSALTRARLRAGADLTGGLFEPLVI